MSSKCSAAVFDRYPAGGGEFALALALADNAHEDGTHIFPSVETMAKKSRQSVRAVQMHLRKMQEIGWLELVKNGRGGRGRVAEYRINGAWLKGADLAPFSEPQKGAIGGTERVQSDALKGANQSSPYITSRTPSEPNTPLPPKGGGHVAEASDAEAGAGAVDQEGAGALGFDDFWRTWPDHENKQGEDVCRRKWQRKRLDRFAAVIVADVRTRCGSEKWLKGFVESPAKYLKESRWHVAVQTSAQSWADTREGVEAMGERLGLGRWDRAEFERTNAQSAMYHVYAERVKTEFKRQVNGAN